MFDSNQFFGGGAGDFYPVSIDQSLRFNDDDSAYLSKNMSTVTGAWTLSMWIKRTGIGKSYDPIGSFRADEYRFENDALKIEGTFTSSMLFRDPSAWYHLVFSDSGSNQTVYVNGESIGTTGFTRDFGDSGTVIGRMAYNSTFFDGYMAEVHFTDGTAYDADDFGELKSGVWVAKTPSVTYGTNGFYLDFANSADIGNDVSGEGNDWTPNNFTASDVVADSPTNNFATWNPLKPTTANFKDGNLVIDAVANYYQSSSTMPIPEDMSVYFELTWTGFSGTSGYGFFGVCTEANAVSTTNDNHPVGTYGCSNIAAKTDDGVPTAGFFSWSTSPDGTVYGFAVDRTNDVLKIYRNGVYESGKDITIPSTGNLFIWASVYDPVELTLNAGQQPFKYDPPE